MLLGVIVLLGGCASASVGVTAPPKESEPVPERFNPETIDMTVMDVCQIIEREAFKAGLAKVSGISQSKHQEQIDWDGIPVQISRDVISTVQTVYQLPIKTDEAAFAYSNFVYERCAINNTPQ